MSAGSSIEWTETTWSPVTGCDRCSDGCRLCYALTLSKRLKAMGSAKYQNDGDPKTSGPGFGVTLHPFELDVPATWRKPRLVFVCSMSDLFHPDVPAQFIVEVFAAMALAREHTFQVLTKRSSRMRKLLTDRLFWASVAQAMIKRSNSWRGDPAGVSSMGYLPNVWLGVSIENNANAYRANHLRQTPAAVRWISAEPLLGPLGELDLTGIDWLVAGGESGPSAAACTPMHPEWVRDLRDRCTSYRCPNCSASFSLPLGMSCDDHHPVRGPLFFYKQAGQWAPPGPLDVIDERAIVMLGAFDDYAIIPALTSSTDDGGTLLMPQRSKSGRVLDGRTWDEMPEVRR